MVITFNELRRIKDKLPSGSSQRIADELGIDVDTVRNYFGGKHYDAKGNVGIHVEQGPDGGVVTLDDTRSSMRRCAFSTNNNTTGTSDLTAPSRGRLFLTSVRHRRIAPHSATAVPHGGLHSVAAGAIPPADDKRQVSQEKEEFLSPSGLDGRRPASPAEAIRTRR